MALHADSKQSVKTNLGIYDDPALLAVKNAEAPVVLDGKLDEENWSGTPSLLFGNVTHMKKQAGDQMVTGGVDVRASFDVNGVIYHKPNTDSSWLGVQLLTSRRKNEVNNFQHNSCLSHIFGGSLL
jgi:hypothetical protein